MAIRKFVSLGALGLLSAAAFGLVGCGGGSSNPNTAAHVRAVNAIVGAPGLKDEHLPVFDVAVGERAITHTGHIDMMAATQPFLSGAISKTVNMPQSATVEDIADAYTHG